MKTTKRANADELTHLVARVAHVIGSPVSASAETRYLFSKTPPQRRNQAGELGRKPASSPRMWNETLSLAADG